MLHGICKSSPLKLGINYFSPYGSFKINNSSFEGGICPKNIVVDPLTQIVQFSLELFCTPLTFTKLIVLSKIFKLIPTIILLYCYHNLDLLNLQGCMEGQQKIKSKLSLGIF